VLWGLGVALALLFALPAAAQTPPTLAELKQEIARRAEHNLAPLTGLKPADVYAALAKIKSLDRDEWAAAWSAIAEIYAARAKSAEAKHQEKLAHDDELMAWRLYSFARWPVANSPGKAKAYREALEAYRAAARFLDPPMEIVHIPFAGMQIAGYLRLSKRGRPVALVLTIGGLASRKEDMAEEGAAFLRHGIGFLALDMPGTGETPIKADVGAEKMFSAALDYLAKRPEIDRRRIILRGLGWSGYWAAKIAITERARVKGAVVQGAPIHFFFQADWQKKSLATPDFLFDLFPARAAVFGVNSLDDFLAYGTRMSLQDEGLIDKPAAPMLLVNGEKDSQVPIWDLDLMLHNGSAKEAWVNPNGFHDGVSPDWPAINVFDLVVLPWILKRAEPEPAKLTAAGG